MIFPTLNLTKEECEGAIRRLELEAYSNLISVFRAQGCLNNEKVNILKDIRRLLFITDERHRAEARRAANDEYLATIANEMFGPNSELQWLKEGRRSHPLLNRKAPLSSLTNIANRAAKFYLNKKPPPPKVEKKRNNSSTNSNIEEKPENKHLEVLKTLYAFSGMTPEITKTEIEKKPSNIISSGELKIDIHKIEQQQQLQNAANISTNQYESHIDSNIIDKGTFVVSLNNEQQEKPSSTVGNVNLIGNIFNLKRKSTEKIGEIMEISQEKLIKHDITKETIEMKPQIMSIIPDQTSIKSNQSVAVQKIINPLVIDNMKVQSSNSIQLKEGQSNRKTVKLITAPNGKLFIQPAQSTNRVTNIRPLTAVNVKSNQCIALKKVTPLAAATSTVTNVQSTSTTASNIEIQPKSIKIGKPNMIILPKTSLKQIPETENTSKYNIPTATIISSAAPTTPTVINETSSPTITSSVSSQSNVFVIGSVINQSLATIDKNIEIKTATTDDEVLEKNNLKNLITEDTPVDIIPAPLETVYETQNITSPGLKIITTTTTVDNRIDTNAAAAAAAANQQMIKDNPQILNQENVIFSETDWELELDQEVAAQQRSKQRRHGKSSNPTDDENFNSVIEELNDEVSTEDSYSEYEDQLQYEELHSP